MEERKERYEKWGAGLGGSRTMRSRFKGPSNGGSSTVSSRMGKFVDSVDVSGGQAGSSLMGKCGVTKTQVFLLRSFVDGSSNGRFVDVFEKDGLAFPSSPH